jgi:hypothetical protein
MGPVATAAPARPATDARRFTRVPDEIPVQQMTAEGAGEKVVSLDAWRDDDPLMGTIDVRV